MIRNQLTQAEARRLFDYRDGMLYWKYTGSGHRKDSAAITSNGGQSLGNKYVRLEGRKFLAHYLIWNWHNGLTSVRIVIGGPSIRIENLREVDDKFIAQQLPTSSSCPCCGNRVSVPVLDVIAFNSGLQPLEKKVLRAVWDGKGMPVQTARIIDAMYGDDEDGGPEQNRAYQNMKIAMTRLRGKLNGTGIGVVNCGYGAGYRLVMGAVS